MKNEIEGQLRESLAEEITIRETLKRGVAEMLPAAYGDCGLEKQLKERRIKLYLGIDPTSPDLHIGHTVPLRKLRQFQDLGHEVVLLFGTFTGMIGDPSDKTAARVRLTPEQIERNVATYAEQAGRVLDMSPKAKNSVKIAYNHEWLGKMTFAEVVDLMSNLSVQQMMERRGFRERWDKGTPIWLHEFTYPLMQGWDAVAMGVDLEVGGRDQTFNMLVGRDLVKRYQDREKWVMATKLIEDPDGKKMGKTEGNIVNVNAWPEWKYEAVMTWPDGAIPLGFELLTSVPMEQVYVVQELLDKGEINPLDLKRALAYRVVKDLDGEAEAVYAESEFDRVMRRRELPKRIMRVEVEQGLQMDEMVLRIGLASDLDQARRLIAQGAVWVDGKQIKMGGRLTGSEEVVRLGKKTIKNVRGLVW